MRKCSPEAALIGCAVFALLLGAEADRPAYRDPEIGEKDRKHWSFRPPVRPDPPAPRGSNVQNPIDRFLYARLEEARLEPVPEAPPLTLIRRVTFDLTGLPPTPEEIDGFLEDGSPGAYERLVDRLLASTSHGERWAQLWLDLARFAETDGFEHDKVRPEAWRYRDWVIDALNGDMPYDHFVRLQIAADEIEPENAAAASATGFLLSGPDMPDINSQEERRHVVLNEMAGTVGQVFMGLTFGCAECHDHKIDPISLGDFYRMRAVFTNVVRTERDKPLGTTAEEREPRARVDHVMLRGDFRSPGPEAEPAFPRILNPEARPFVAAPTARSTGRRRAFAEWLTRAEHPLFARWIVNWLWVHHFGRGIVPTAGDFGIQGAEPSHPALLDWLATELPRRGWSLKAMHRLMVTSAAYRRDSRPSGPGDEAWPRAAAADPQNVLLGRRSRRRLEGEAIRDAMLAVSGRMSRRRGGPGVRPPLPAEVTSTLLKDQWQVSPDPEDHLRRSVYVFARRNLRYPLFEAFDRPSADSSCPRRNRSTTATQSLMLINSELSNTAARDLAARILAGGAAGPESLVESGYRLALGRPPEAAELRQGVEFLAAQAGGVEAGLPGALSDFCLALFNSNEFAYID